MFLLTDSESSYNFIDNRIAKKLGCVLEPILVVKVSATNGNELVSKEIYKHFQKAMQENQFQADFLILPLDNFDMILGIQT